MIFNSPFLLRSLDKSGFGFGVGAWGLHLDLLIPGARTYILLECVFVDDDFPFPTYSVNINVIIVGLGEICSHFLA